jgi:hypothetical protein
MTYQFRLREEPFEFYSEFDNAEESLTTDFAGTRQGEGLEKVLTTSPGCRSL